LLPVTKGGGLKIPVMFKIFSGRKSLPKGSSSTSPQGLMQEGPRLGKWFTLQVSHQVPSLSSAISNAIKETEHRSAAFVTCLRDETDAREGLRHWVVYAAHTRKTTTVVLVPELICSQQVIPARLITDCKMMHIDGDDIIPHILANMGGCRCFVFVEDFEFWRRIADLVAPSSSPQSQPPTAASQRALAVTEKPLPKK